MNVRLPFAPLLALSACGPEPAAPPTLVVSLDTVRADALSCYGGERADTPALDALAADGIRFANVLASSPNTAPSHATLFTGLPPLAHRVANVASARLGTPALAPGFVTLAERFADEGYETIALTDDGPLGTGWNLLQGFEIQRIRYQDVERKVDAARRYLTERDDERPPFLFLHTYQAHQPFVPPLEFEERFAGGYDGPLAARVAGLRERSTGELENDGQVLLEGRASFTDADVRYLESLYLAEVAYTDRVLGRWFERLLSGPEGESWMVSVTADHGEEFGEHGHFGHSQLYVETLRVPWILRMPKGRLAGTVFEPEVGLVDVAATLLDAAGLAPTTGVPPRSLLPYVAEDLAPDRPRFASTTEHLLLGATVAQRTAVRTDADALLRRERSGDLERLERYERSADPLERRPITQSGDERAERGMTRLLDEHLAESAALGTALLGSTELHLSTTAPETLRQMQALGYVDEKE